MVDGLILPMPYLSADSREHERNSLWRQSESNSRVSDKDTFFHVLCLIKTQPHILGNEPGCVFLKVESSSRTKNFISHSIALFLYFQIMYDGKLKAVAYASKNLSELNVLGMS